MSMKTWVRRCTCGTPKSLGRLGCDVYWVEQFRSRKDPDRDQRALATTFFERMERFGPHRLSTLKHCNPILRIEHGRVVGIEPAISVANEEQRAFDDLAEAAKGSTARV
jgi:hypothetical protein